MVVEDVAAFVPRILVVAWLKCERSVNEIEIQIREAEPVEARLEGPRDALGAMVCVPYFCGDEDVICGDEDVIASDTYRGESFLQRSAYFALVPVALGAIEVPEAGHECVSGCRHRGGRVGNLHANSPFVSA